MSSYITDYNLKALSWSSSHDNGQIRDCVINEKIDLDTPLGILTPQYEHAGVRRKHTYSVSFYENGKIRRIALNEQTYVQTPVGSLPAELITFYETGSIKRLFPLNGLISGYWDEDDEYGLAPELTLDLPIGSFKTKAIGIAFYEDGAVRSLTLWPREMLAIQTPIGKQNIRTGFALYRNGCIKSFEPARPVPVTTPIGLITAYDTNATGITGDMNSFVFTDDGRIKSLTTSNTQITVTGPGGTKIFSPLYIREMAAHELFFQPLKIEFDKGKVRFNGQDEYLIKECSFKPEPFARTAKKSCSDCSSCKQCTFE